MIFGLLILVSLANVFASLSTVSHHIKWDDLISGLPDQLVEFLTLEFCFHDIPVLMKVNQLTRFRLIKQSIFQRYLAKKYSLPSLATLPHELGLLNLEAPCWKFNPFYGKILTPKNLYRRLEMGVEPSPLVEEVTLRLFEFFAENPVEDLIFKGDAFAHYAWNLILRKRGWKLFNQVKGLFGNFSFALDQENSMAMVTWFHEDREGFVKFFFGTQFLWNREALLAFFTAPLMHVSENFALDQVTSFLNRIAKLILDKEFNHPELDESIYQKVAPYLEAHQNIKRSFVLEFNIRFNANFKYRITPNGLLKSRSKLAALLVLAAKYDDAIELFPLKIDHLPHQEIIMSRPEFCFYLIAHSRAAYMETFDTFPDEFFIEQRGFQCILRAHGVQNLDALLNRIPSRLEGLACINWCKLVLNFGNLKHFRKLLEKLNQSSLDEVLEFKKDDPELPDYLDLLKKWSEKEDTELEVSLASVRILLQRPEALRRCKGHLSLTEIDTHEELEALKEYQNASKDIQILAWNML